jgi:hypothetical protein
LSSGGGVGGPPEGEPGEPPGGDYRAMPPVSCTNPGGRGGGRGGTPGEPGGYTDQTTNLPGGGGGGGGPYGGQGAAALSGGNGDCGQQLFGCGFPEEPGANGLPGGYRLPGSNGDPTPDANDDVFRGSGGGGGGGGWRSGGYCCGSGVGGTGGVLSDDTRDPVYAEFLMDFVNCTCQAGGGGAGGAAGGGSVRLVADEIVIAGEVDASGAGDAALGAGYGAGGGVLLRATTRVLFEVNGVVRALGGDSDDNGSAVNGGTVKVRAPEVSADGSAPADHIEAGAISVVTEP